MTNDLVVARREFISKTNRAPVAVELGRVEYRACLLEAQRVLRESGRWEAEKEARLEQELLSMTGTLGLTVYGVAIRLVKIDRFVRFVME